jgi:protocatechuate 3,4-dioxygenase, beta subunit
MIRKNMFAAFCFTTIAWSACGQNSANGIASPPAAAASNKKPCEGCAGINESPVPHNQLPSMTWLPDWNEPGRKLAVNGTVYMADGKTPASGVIIYIYHTNQQGIYPRRGDEIGEGKRHGYLRGWMKTDEKGFYKFFTLRPAHYPGGTAPAHIHIIIKEPGKDPYWIDDYLFDDDPALTSAERSRLRNRGGSGILKVSNRTVLKAERNIYLGKNIDD